MFNLENIEDRKSLIKIISGNKTAIKIILKCYNDKFFLRKWIDYYGRIAGLDSIIIADNQSDDPQVLRIYDEFKDKIIIFSYGGFHNNIHIEEIFPDIYKAIKSSCDYYIFLDVDEFLIFFDGLVWDDDQIIIKELERVVHAPENFDYIPLLTFSNIPYSDSMYRVDYMQDSLKWGKPLCKSECKKNHNGVHNCQIFNDDEDLNIYYDSKLVILHNQNLSLEQRLVTNIAKLNKRGLCARDASFDSILNSGWSKWEDETAIRFVEELVMLKNYAECDISYDSVPRLILNPDKTVAYSNLISASALALPIVGSLCEALTGPR